jgi:hypothetical protein
MRRCASTRSAARVLVVFGIVCSGFVFAQQGQPPGGRGGGAGQARPGVTAASLVLKVDWVRPASQTGQVPVVQENIADPNIELKWYGKAAHQLLTTGTPGSDVTPFGVWSGECAGPYVITFKQKNNYVDLTGTARIRWPSRHPASTKCGRS